MDLIPLSYSQKIVQHLVGCEDSANSREREYYYEESMAKVLLMAKIRFEGSLVSAESSPTWKGVVIICDGCDGGW